MSATSRVGRDVGSAEAVDSLLASPDRFRRQVIELRRERLLDAMVEICVQDGLDAASVARLNVRAECSRRLFYELFADRQACFIAALDRAVREAAEHARPAYLAEERWLEKIRSGLLALLHFFDARPDLAVVCFLAAGTPEPRILSYRQSVLNTLAEIVDRGPDVGDSKPPAAWALTVVGGAIEVIRSHIVRDRTAGLSGLANELTAVILLPYLGPTGARRELVREHAESLGKHLVADLPSLRRTPPRLTHRTMLVLAVIVERPGLSNADVARASGVGDQGQISRLLSRLAALGLVENTGPGHALGGPNAWRATAGGAELVRSFSSVLSHGEQATTSHAWQVRHVGRSLS